MFVIVVNSLIKRIAKIKCKLVCSFRVKIKRFKSFEYEILKTVKGWEGDCKYLALNLEFHPLQ